MPPKLALTVGAVFVLYAYRTARRRGIEPIAGLGLPTLWYLIVSSRPFGFWLTTWGIPVPGGGGGLDQGSIIDATFFLVLTLLGIRALSRRRFDWGSALRANPWATALLAFMAASIVWSAFPYISFKRYVKIVGSLTMAFLVLTTENPLESTFTVLRRVFYIHLPMSIICIKYFRNLGVEFDWSGSSFAWKGICTSKNDLGQVAMLGVLCFAWLILQRWRDYRWKNLHVVYLLMALYLLKGSETAISVTSVATCLFATVVLLRLKMLHSDIAAARRFVRVVFTATVSLVLLIIAHSIFMFSESSLFGRMITAFGRNITLTDRTYIWHDMYAIAAKDPFLGVGFGGFWIGRVANIPWDDKMTWVLGQGHDGYIDSYLQIGLIGCFFLAATIFATMPRLLSELESDFDFACVRITLFLTILFVNVTETTLLRGDHHFWFIMQLVIWIVPITAWSRGPAKSEPTSELASSGNAEALEPATCA